MESIFIAFTGVHGSGKTTGVNNLAAKLRANGKKVIVIKEGARKYEGDLNTFTAQDWVWEYKLNQEAMACGTDVDYIIGDRTIMDLLMYYRYMLIYGCNEPTTIEGMEVWAFRMLTAENMMSRYDHIIRMPLNLEWLQSPDPLRNPGVYYAMIIDKLFDRYVEQYVNTAPGYFEEIV